MINTFFDLASTKHFSVRRLSIRKEPNKQLFIVTIDNDNKSDNFYIVPFAEFSYRRDLVSILVDPNKQYPELNQCIGKVIEKVKFAILGYMSQY